MPGKRGRPKKPEAEKKIDDRVAFSVRMPKPAHKSLKLICTSRDIDMNDALNEALSDWLTRQPELKASEALSKASANATA